MGGGATERRGEGEIWWGPALRVLLVDDKPDHRAMYGDLLRRDDEIDVVGEVRHPMEVEERVEALRPDVVVLDLEFEGVGTRGVDLARQLRRRNQRLGILLLTAFPTFEVVDEFLACTEGGGRGVLEKGTDDGEGFVSNVKQIARGKQVMGSLQTGYANYQKLAKLSPENRLILKLLADGNSYATIARQLKEKVGYELAERTIQQRVNQMAKDFGVDEIDEFGNPKDRGRQLAVLYQSVEKSVEPRVAR